MFMNNAKPRRYKKWKRSNKEEIESHSAMKA